MKFNYQELFPLLRYGTRDEFEGHCRFYFPDDPSECLSYVDETMHRIEDEIRFAWDACHTNNNESAPSLECCKRRAQDNEVAYEYCVDQVKQMEDARRQATNVFSVRNIVLGFLTVLLLVTMVAYATREWESRFFVLYR